MDILTVLIIPAHQQNRSFWFLQLLHFIHWYLDISMVFLWFNFFPGHFIFMFLAILIGLLSWLLYQKSCHLYVGHIKYQSFACQFYIMSFTEFVSPVIPFMVFLDFSVQRTSFTNWDRVALVSVPYKINTNWIKDLNVSH